MDVNTRRLRYMLALADELHFGRAAARFFIAQQAMSRQIRDLERDLGVILFERTTRSVRLTTEGAAFRDAVSAALGILDDGIRTVQSADRATSGILNVGFRFGAALELTQPLLEALASSYPELTVSLREMDFRRPWQTSGKDDVDVAIVRSSFDRSDLRFDPLFTEPLVAAVARGHPLAARETVVVADLADVEIVVADYQDAAWHRYWTLEEHLGATSRRITHTTSQTEELQMVAAGSACSINAASSARFMPHPGISYLLITDIPPCTMGLAWNADTAGPLARAFVDTALAVRDRERAITAFIEDPFGRVAPG